MPRARSSQGAEVICIALVRGRVGSSRGDHRRSRRGDPFDGQVGRPRRRRRRPSPAPGLPARRGGHAGSRPRRQGGQGRPRPAQAPSQTRPLGPRPRPVRAGLRRRNLPAPPRKHPRSSDRRFRGVTAHGGRYGRRDLARPHDRLVPVAGVGPEPRGGAARRQSPARRARREDRRPRAALERRADPGVPALARGRSRGGAGTHPPFEDQERARLVHRRSRTATTKRRS